MTIYQTVALCLVAILAGLAGFNIQKRRIAKVGFVTELLLRFLWVLSLCQIFATLFANYPLPPGSLPVCAFLTVASLSFWLGRRIAAMRQTD